MPSGYGHWTGSNDGGGGAVIGVVALAISAGVVVWKLAAALETALAVALAVMGALSVAGITLLVRELRSGRMTRFESEALLIQMFRRRRIAESVPERLVLTPIPVPAALPVKPRAALVARQVAPGEYVAISESEKVDR